MVDIADIWNHDADVDVDTKPAARKRLPSDAEAGDCWRAAVYASANGYASNYLL